ncbi:hypothetical protein Bbelb_121020 [Branchiostoma belcheri]|nr:hypothetical protein Bbelb_121020 [Branchiostoma belcheri]
MGKPAGVLMFLLVILKVLGTAEADCSCTASYCRYVGAAEADFRCTASACNCRYQGLTSVPQDLPTTITWLDLGGNQITTIRLGNLTTLYLSNNKLTHLRSDMFTGLGNLEDLDLDDRLGNLETLDLDDNDITDIQAGTFDHTPQLKNLALHYNKLTTLRSDILKVLGAAEADFRCRSGMFTGLENLGALSLRNNEISDIQAGTFNSTPQLRRLELYNNKLTTLRSDMFTGLGNLLALSLDNNEISDIQAGTFNSTPQLRYLFLYNTQIQTIPSNSLTNLMQLRFLKLSDNSITTFPFDELSRLQRLYQLDLYNNQLTTLPSIAYDILSSISTVIIDNNPWQCDCRMVGFRLKMNGSYPFENQITCSQPDNLHGLELKHVPPEDLICEGPTTGLMSPVTSPPPTTVATNSPEPSTVQNSSITS